MVGVRDGFKHLVRRDVSHVSPLGIDDVSRIHLLGGSILGTSRENPTKSPEATRAVVETLQHAGISGLITIGGDDTALSARYISEISGGAIRSVHVPITIDNDLPLPPHIPTFGFQTARHVGVELLRNLMDDARSTRRWYVVVAMGRKAGHLALGIGKAAGATLTLVAEEWTSRDISFATICDVVEGAIVKRRAMGRHFGVAMLAEGLIDKLSPAELAELQDVERDDHGHIRFAEVDLARKVKAEVQGRLSQRGIRVTITEKNIGYELRCADPISFDAEYCRDLGHGAVRFLLGGGSGAMVTIQAGRLVSIPFDELREPETGKTRVRLVNIHSESFRVARAYMIRLEADDFANAAWVDRLADAARLSPAGSASASSISARCRGEAHEPRGVTPVKRIGTMGRPTGHLTLGIGKAVSATRTIIPEEFPEGPISLSDIADIVEGSIIKRRAMGSSYGVALLSEALVERFSPREVAELQDVDRDAQGNIRVTEIDLGRKVKNEVQMRLEQRGIR